jgi:hypothetical protein
VPELLLTGGLLPAQGPVRELFSRLGLPARSVPGGEGGGPGELHLRRELVASQAEGAERGVRSKCAPAL